LAWDILSLRGSGVQIPPSAFSLPFLPFFAVVYESVRQILYGSCP
jgi:hypothetical protein